MDFGVLSHREASPNAALKDSTEHTNGNANGSGNLKEKRSKLAEDSLRVTKMQRQFRFEIPNQKTENLIAFGRSSLLLSEGDEGQKMLSFSSSEPHGQSENYSSARGGSNEGIRGGYARLKGPFTPYQWMELERHALIYKHILANVPIPSNLTAPLRTPYASSGSYSSNFLGWGPFHQGFSGSNDPEPGRCRRTDGKKWRCSRDAVPDQKYCERHINRGRHRSRKPVEGQSGHALSGSVTSAVAPTASSSSKTLADMQPKRNSLQPSTLNLANRNQGFQDLSASLSIHKQNVPFEEPSNSEFGIVYTEALVNPSQRMPCLNTKDTSPFSNFNNQETNNQYPACHFIDDNPKELKSDWTQLSMSIPATHSEFSSSSYPSLTMSTERPSIELDPIQMSLGVGNDDVSESVQKQLDWLPPVSWGSSMGSPLGEVLTRTAMGTSSSSPDGVLQKSTIFSLSNSSWGSGDSADKRLPEDASCQGGLVSAITSL